eukprot:2233744-Prymnesium_polylepis.1
MSASRVVSLVVTSDGGPSQPQEPAADASSPPASVTSFVSLAEVNVSSDIDPALTTPPPSSRRRMTPRLSRRSSTRTSKGSTSSAAGTPGAAETPLSPPSLASRASRVRRALTSSRRPSGRDSPFADVHDDSGTDDEREGHTSDDHKESPLSRTQMRDRRMVKEKVRSMKAAFVRGVRGVSTKRHPRGDLLD